MATNNSWNNQIAAANSAITLNAGTNNVNISTDASATTVSIGSGAAAKTVTLGSTNSTSATTLQSGSGALAITSTNGTLTANSGTGALSISSDASATTVNIATGAAAKAVTLGSTNSTSSLDLQFGTSDFSLASATGDIITAADTGEVLMPLQPSFYAYKNGTASNVTGDGTRYDVAGYTEVFDQNGDFDPTTGVFTAPVTGVYDFGGIIQILQGNTSTFWTMGFYYNSTTTLQNYQMGVSPLISGIIEVPIVLQYKMTAADTMSMYTTWFGGTKTVDIDGSAANITKFWAKLVC